MNDGAPEPTAEALGSAGSEGPATNPTAPATEPPRGLEGLRDIHLPDNAGPWPPAPGWWLLLGALVLLALLGGLLYRRWRRGRAYRQAVRAWRQLRHAYRQTGDQRALAQGLSRLLRRYALARAPADEVAGLTGERWLYRLDTLAGDDHAWFRRGAGRQLIEAPYHEDPELDGEALLHGVRQWLRYARR